MAATLSAYELDRLENIKRNQDVLQKLGLLDDVKAMRQPEADKVKSERKKREPVEHVKREPSARQAGREAPNYAVDLDDMDRLIESKKARTAGSREIKEVRRFDPSSATQERRHKPKKDKVVLNWPAATAVDHNKILEQMPQQAPDLPSNKALITLREWGATSQHLTDAGFPDESISAFANIEQEMPFDDTCKICFKKPGNASNCVECQPMEQELKFSLMPYRLMVADRLNLACIGAKPKVQCPDCGKHFSLVLQAKRCGGALHGHMCNVKRVSE